MMRVVYILNAYVCLCVFDEGVTTLRGCVWDVIIDDDAAAIWKVDVLFLR